jgi:hypothetical protein
MKPKSIAKGGTGGSKAQGTSTGSGSRPGGGKYPIASSHPGHGGKK